MFKMKPAGLAVLGFDLFAFFYFFSSTTDSRYTVITTLYNVFACKAV